jgi:hypothetical protein
MDIDIPPSQFSFNPPQPMHSPSLFTPGGGKRKRSTVDEEQVDAFGDRMVDGNPNSGQIQMLDEGSAAKVGSSAHRPSLVMLLDTDH